MKEIFIMLLMGMLVFASSGSTTMKNALGELENTAKGFLAVTSIILIVGGAILSAIGIFIYYNKLKDKQQRPTLWLILTILIGGFGGLSLLGGILGLILYLLMPTFINSMIGGPIS